MENFSVIFPSVGLMSPTQLVSAGRFTDNSRDSGLSSAYPSPPGSAFTSLLDEESKVASDICLPPTPDSLPDSGCGSPNIDILDSSSDSVQKVFRQHRDSLDNSTGGVQTAFIHSTDNTGDVQRAYRYGTDSLNSSANSVQNISSSSESLQTAYRYGTESLHSSTENAQTLNVQQTDSSKSSSTQDLTASSTPSQELSGKSSDKPTHSFVALIAMAILNSPERRLVLCDIYQYISDRYPYYQEEQRSWRNSVRHNLSLNECFIKMGRAENGKGNYWAIHPACMTDFSQGDYSKRHARRRNRSKKPYSDASVRPSAYRSTAGFVPMAATAVLPGQAPYYASGLGVPVLPQAPSQQMGLPGKAPAGLGDSRISPVMQSSLGADRRFSPVGNTSRLSPIVPPMGSIPHLSPIVSSPSMLDLQTQSARLSELSSSSLSSSSEAGRAYSSPVGYSPYQPLYHSTPMYGNYSSMGHQGVQLPATSSYPFSAASLPYPSNMYQHQQHYYGGR